MKRVGGFGEGVEMKEMHYRGFLMRARSYQVLTEGGEPRGWMPGADVVREVPGGLHSIPLLYEGQETFRTREEADEYAFGMAKAWIDARG